MQGWSRICGCHVAKCVQDSTCTGFDVDGLSGCKGTGIRRCGATLGVPGKVGLFLGTLSYDDYGAHSWT